MPRVYVSVGSNIEREVNVLAAIKALESRYGELTLSSVYESRAVGFDGADFYNMVVGFDTDEEPVRIAQALKNIEIRQGRDRTDPRFSDRTLDLDLLLYGQQVIDEPGLSLPRRDILEHAFVLEPLAEIAGDEVHPVVNRTYRDLWQDSDALGSELRAVPDAFAPDGSDTEAAGN